MKTNSKFVLSAIAGLGVAALASAPVLAADVTYQEPPAPAPIFEAAPVSTWAGPYAGLQLGYGFGGNTDVSPTGLPGVGIDTDGFIGGGFAGYNFQSGGFVYGLEADVNYNNMRGDNARFESRDGVDGSLRARAGVAVTDDILVYGTAGGAAQRLKVTDTTVAGASDTKTMTGYTVGAGVDARMTEQVFARAEYRYTDYGSKTFDLPGVGATEADSSNHRLMLGVGIKF